MGITSKEEALEVLRQSRYSRIASRIELMWGTDELSTYFKELIISDRETRQGFPNDIFHAILKLSNLNDGIGVLEVIKR